MRLLIVEDEPKTGEYLKKGLTEHGYSVDVARTGAEGLYLALETDYDLILLDVMLPGMNGWDVLAKLREKKETPVLFLTARDQVDDRVKGLELGADDYLVKPFAFSELLARVGLSHRVEHRPSELSGGEQQRTAVARALALDPAIFLADEPSGNLDHANAELLHDLLSTLARDLEIAMVVVTHNRSLARRADRALHMEDGVLREADVQGVIG